MRKFLVTLFVLMAFSLNFAAGVRAETAGEVWKRATAKIKALKDYKCTLYMFTIDTPTALKYRPLNDMGEKNIENWYTYKVEMVWKRPGYSHIKILAADTPGIDFATNHIKEKPGTEIVFGYRDVTDLYAKFPRIGRPEIDKMISRNIFHVPVEVYEGARPHSSFNESIESMTMYLSRYFKAGKVTLETKPCVTMKNLKYNQTSGELAYESEKTEEAYYKFTLTPDDIAKNLGITREIIYLDTGTLMPLQLESFERDKLVFVVNVEDLETNTGLDDSLWENYFEDANVIDHQGSF